MCIRDRFKDRVLNSDLKNIKCEVKILPDEHKYMEADNLVWPYFSGNHSYDYKMGLLVKFPFWREQINQAVSQKKCLLTPYQDGRFGKFLISGKYPAFLELVNILEQIGVMCQKQTVKNIILYDFQALMISQAALKRCF